MCHCNVLVYDRQGYGKSCDFTYTARDNGYMELEAVLLILILLRVTRFVLLALVALNLIRYLSSLLLLTLRKLQLSQLLLVLLQYAGLNGVLSRDVGRGPLASLVLHLVGHRDRRSHLYPQTLSNNLPRV